MSELKENTAQDNANDESQTPPAASTIPATDKKAKESKQSKPASVKISAPKTAKSKSKETLVEVDVEPLTAEEKKTRAVLEAAIAKSQTNADNGFFETAAAFRQIMASKLYRGEYKSFEAYCGSKWKFSRSHAYRVAGAGEVIARNKHLSPHGDTVKFMNTEGHYRPLLKLEPDDQDAVIAKVAEWVKWSGEKQLTPKMVEAVKLVLCPPSGPNRADEKKNTIVAQIEAAADEMKGKLPADASKETTKIFDEFKKKVGALGNPKRTSGIDWTDATWNPLQGCTRASAGCDNCYAARDVATRLAHVYPGLATMKMNGTKKTYLFNGVIRLLPEQLGEPLRDRTPRRYFVNSMSDLFHKNVPEAFIEAVFDVMTKAHWHQFQVLTKRPDRMAEFTAKYFTGKTPPENIWLGTSAENQEMLDERLPHLKKTVAAVKWLSCEPLLGPIKFESLEGVDWVVAGGESGPAARQMKKEWATSMRDACEKAKVAFFFKQWGAYGEDGTKPKKPKKDGLTPPSLDGVVHNAYPQERLGVESGKPAKAGKTSAKAGKESVKAEGKKPK